MEPAAPERQGLRVSVANSIIGLGLAFNLFGGGGCSSCKTNDERHTDRRVESARHLRCVEPSIVEMENFHGFLNDEPGQPTYVGMIKTRYVYRDVGNMTSEQAAALEHVGPFFTNPELFRDWLSMSKLRMYGDE